MSKQKVLTYLSIALMLLNIVVLFLFFSKNPENRKREGPKKLIIERLHLDKQQQIEYDKLIETHQKNIRTKNKEAIELKQVFFDNIETNNVGEKDSLEKLIGQKQIEIENIHYAHFVELKKICHENQLSDFNNLVKDLSTFFSKHPPQ